MFVEQTDGITGCAGSADTAQIRDQLTGALIGIARAADGNPHLIGENTTGLMVQGLAATANEKADNAALESLLQQVKNEKQRMIPNCFTCVSPCGRTSDYDMNRLWNGDESIRSLKSRILFGIRDAAVLSPSDDAVHRFFYKALFALGMDDWDEAQLLPIVLEAEGIKDALLEPKNP